MVKSSLTTSINLLADQLKKFDEPGLFGLNYQLPEYLKANLKDNLRPYQEEALRYFHYSQFKQDIADKDYKHLLFNMATGSG